MGLDINFYKESKLDPRYRENIGYFGKVNFILTYFNVSEDMNCEHVHITETQFKQFISDLDNELYRKFRHGGNIPANEKLKTKAIFFGGSIDYDKGYWYNVCKVRDWAQKVIKDIDWDKDELLIVAWW